MYVCNVILDLPLRSSYSYLSDKLLEQGTRVTVEFRNKQYIGFVLSCTLAHEFNDYPIDKLSKILQISSSKLSLPNQFIELAKFVSEYYHHPLGTTIFSGIPALLRKIGEPDIEETKISYYTTTQNEFKSKSKSQQLIYNSITNYPLNAEQIRLLYGKNPNQIIKELLIKNFIQECSPPNPSFTSSELKLNHEQANVVKEFLAHMNEFHTGIIYGITGSGKTEVFLHIIKQVIAQQKQVLVLVPEINLTPQLLTRFKSRFPNANINVLNSEVSDKQRFKVWLSGVNGDNHIILGTRLSIFTPIKNLGLIIVDEEHDDSFKQNDGLRYHARNLAVWRANKNNIPIMLASATPSLETLYNYKLGKYKLYKLTQRAVTNAVLPQVELINLQHYPVNYAGINQAAIDKLAECLSRKEMALVFINRRGYAPIITCYDCGWVSECRYCSTKMVYHHSKHQLKCHHCGYQIQVPPECPKCHNQYLHTIGHGTQKLEEFLQQHFPNAKIERVDRDTTNNKKAWDEIYKKVETNQIDILVGTQMLAKGHDFPNLTLVIGLNLDNALFSYDFRASEDMFNLLTQVSGRAGRADKSGIILLQTNYPDHPVYQFLKEYNFNGFINHTLRERKINNLPPFCHYALIKLSTYQEEKLKLSLHDLYQEAKKIPHQEITIFSAVPAVLYKLHNRYRGQMLISSNNRIALHSYLTQLEAILDKFKNITIAIDVDPIEV